MLLQFKCGAVRYSICLAARLLASACLGAAPLQATVRVEIGQNFTGTTYGRNSFARPADANGAIGPEHFVEFVNGRFSVHDKTNGALVQTMPDMDFWTSAGLSFASNIHVSDPRIVFDPLSQRWFAAAIDYDYVDQSNNRFLLAVSGGANPTGIWHASAFTADPVDGHFADFPTLGLDADGVYLSADAFSAVTGNNIGAMLVSIPKADLLLNPPVITNRTSFGILADRGAVLQPAVNPSGTGARGSVLAAGDLGIDFLAHSNLVAFAVRNAGGPSDATLTEATSILVPPYEVSINPVQPDGTDTLDDGDARFSATVYQVGDVLYAVHGIQVEPRAAIRWYRISAANHTVLESGTLAHPELELFYPSIAANAGGTVVIGCNGCSANSFISSYAFVGETVNETTTFDGPRLLQAGTANYHDSDFGGISRWGDYSATSVDPNDPSRFWTIQMCASAPSVWFTQITEIRASSAALTIATRGTDIALSWPTNATAFKLFAGTNILFTNGWSEVSQPVITNLDHFELLVPADGAGGFFRLQRP